MRCLAKNVGTVDQARPAHRLVFIQLRPRQQRHLTSERSVPAKEEKFKRSSREVSDLGYGTLWQDNNLLARVRDPVDDAGCGMGDQLEVGRVADPADWAVHQLRLAAPADNVAARAAENLQTK